MSAADVVALIGNPRSNSRTRALSDATIEALLPVVTAAGVSVVGSMTLELAEIAAVTFDQQAATATAPVDDPHGTVRSARLLVVATPTYKGTYTGLLKVFLDQYGHRELAGTVAVAVAIAASEPHRAAVGTALSTLLGELGASVPAPALSILEPAAADPDKAAHDWVEQHGHLVAAALAHPAPAFGVRTTSTVAKEDA
jgi:FMN reductase